MIFSVDKARQSMITNQLLPVGVTSYSVLQAFARIAREDFLPDSQKLYPYTDENLLLAGGSKTDQRYLLAPIHLARLFQMVEIGVKDRVLDVCIGTGYSTAVLAQLAGFVVGYENQGHWFKEATFNLSSYKNVCVTGGELLSSIEEHGPYTVIIFEGAICSIPPLFFNQLENHGRIVAVLGEGMEKVARIYYKNGKRLDEQGIFNCAIPLLEPFICPDSFDF